MGANDNTPIGTLPWRLTAAPPGTLDILVDVEDPISWDVGSVTSGDGRISEPLCSQYPVLTTRGNAKGLKGNFTLFIPDTEDRDDVVDAIIAAKQDAMIPYYVWRAMDGAQSWNVQFDPSEKLTIGYLLGHRTVMCSFLQMSENLSTVPPGFVAGVITPPVQGSPTVSTRLKSVYRGEQLPVKFTNVPAEATDAFVGLFPVADVTNDRFNAINYIFLGGATGAELFMPTLPTATVAQYQLRLITSNPRNVVYGPKIDIKAATLTAVENEGPRSVDISWSDFSDDLPALAQFIAPGFTPIASAPISGASGTINIPIYTVDATPVFRIPQLVLASGRKVMGPLS